MSIGRIELVDEKRQYVRYATLGGSGGQSGIQIGNVQDLTLEEGSENLILRWKDPEDVVFNGETIGKWAGTKVVRKEGSDPASVDDGTLVADSKVKDQYAVDGLQDTDVAADTQYNYALFPYTAKNVYTMSDLNRTSGSLASYNPVLANNTWAQIDEASRLGIAKDIWNFGDVKDGYTIIGFNHDDLADGSGKAGITFIADDIDLMPKSIWTNNTTKTYPVSDAKHALDAEYNSLPSDFTKYIKEVQIACKTGYSSSGGISKLNVKLFLPSSSAVTNSRAGSYVTAEDNERYAGIDSIRVDTNERFTRTPFTYNGVVIWYKMLLSDISTAVCSTAFYTDEKYLAYCFCI